MSRVRILVNTVDAWSRNTGSDTMSSLLSSFDSKDVASINIRARRSESRVAGSYFHIFEERVIKSIFRPSIETGEKYLPQPGKENCEELAQETRLYRKRRPLNRYVYVLIREILWKFGHWKSRALDEYVSSFAPDVFFFPIESYIHFNRLNLYIIRKFKPKRIVGYMWDDNFTYKQEPCNPLYLLHRWWLRKSVKKLVASCDAVFAICPKMKRELDAEFGINSVLLTKPIRSTAHPVSQQAASSPIRILYTGKLIIGRDETLALVADAIKSINKEGQKVILDIYTSTPLSAKMKTRLDIPGSSNLKGFISQSEVFKEQEKADILLFVESFSSKNLTARLSFSTKITDYLSTGKCIWAIGNEDLAPIEYFASEDAAMVSTNPESVITALEELVCHPQTISSFAAKARECGNKNHNQQKIQDSFIQTITIDE
ncbi:MAG: hypothetical protein IJU13_02785 [Bacteroidales bacterium]|nr:hypothetical protein [Bacteroidales bacterium]